MRIRHDKLFTVKQMCAVLGFTAQNFYALRRRGKIPKGRMIGGVRYFTGGQLKAVQKERVTNRWVIGAAKRNSKRKIARHEQVPDQTRVIECSASDNSRRVNKISPPALGFEQSSEEGDVS